MSDQNATLISHLKNEAIKFRTPENHPVDNIQINKAALLALLETYQKRKFMVAGNKPAPIKSFLSKFKKPETEEAFQERFEIGLGQVHSIKIDLYRQVADSLGPNYNTKNFDSESYFLGLSYDVIARKTEPFPSTRISPISISAFVALALQANISGNRSWEKFARPYVYEVLSSKDNQIKSISKHFPLMSILVSDDPQRTAHQKIHEHYQLDSLYEPQLVFENLVSDRISNTRIRDNLFTSMYALPVLSYIPLEIIYLSTLIDFSLPNKLSVLKEKLVGLEFVKDDALLALEAYSLDQQIPHHLKK